MKKRIAWLTIFLVTLVTAGALVNISKITFDYEFEHFFPTDDPMLNEYQVFKDRFSTDVDFVIIALRNEAGIFDSTFLADANAMRDNISKIDKVERIFSPFDAKDYALGPFGPIAIPDIHVEDPERYEADSLRIYINKRSIGTLYSTDGKSISLLVELEKDLSKLETDTVHIKLTEAISPFEFDEIHMAGKVIGQAYYIDQIKNEFAVFFLVGVLLIMVVLIIVYRSVWGVIVPLTIVLLAVIWLLGLMGFIGKPIDIMTTLLPLVLFVVGISDVIHVLSRYFEEIRKGKGKLDAIMVAYKQVGLATFLTSFTTALGFLTLTTSGIKPVRELGLLAAAGVFIAFILAFSLLPAILSLNKVPKLALKEPSKVFWNRLVEWIFVFSFRNQSVVLIGAGVLMMVSLAAITRIEVDNYLIEDVGKGNPVRTSFEYIEDNFAGVRPFEMVVEMHDSTESVFSVETVRELQRVETYLKDEYTVGFMMSPLTILRSVNQAVNGGLDSAYVIPASDKELKSLFKWVKRFQKRPEFSALVAEGGHYARVSGKVKDYGGKRISEMNEEMILHFTTVDVLEKFSIAHTGMAVLIDQNNKTLSANMMSGLIFALLIVALMMGVMFKSWKLALVSLIPNILPLLAIGGVMGLFGIDLKVSTSIIFGIGFGIAVDDSIHYLSKYRLLIRRGVSPVFAMRQTSVSTGKAIILTSLILSAGFSALAFSTFTSSFYVGVLVSVTLVVAVLADLFLLPVLLRYIMQESDA